VLGDCFGEERLAVTLVLTRKLLMHPEELLAFVHYADETAESEGWVFGFEQGVEFA